MVAWTAWMEGGTREHFLRARLHAACRGTKAPAQQAAGLEPSGTAGKPKEEARGAVHIARRGAQCRSGMGGAASVAQGIKACC